MPTVMHSLEQAEDPVPGTVAGINPDPPDKPGRQPNAVPPPASPRPPGEPAPAQPDPPDLPSINPDLDPDLPDTPGPPLSDPESPHG
jgi:hypothetical protein